MDLKSEYELDDYQDYDMLDATFDNPVMEANGRVSKSGHGNHKDGQWTCSICTYDNDESLISCDICGVFRNSSATTYISSCEKNVHDRRKDYGISVLAKSLFSQLPKKTPQALLINGSSEGNEARKIGGQGHVSVKFSEFQQIFLTPPSSNPKTIVPFKFDVPSPDDKVFSGKSSSRNIPKVETISKTSIKSGLENEVPDDEIVLMPITGPLVVTNVIRDADTKVEKITDTVRDLKLGNQSTNTKSRKSIVSGLYKPEKWILSIKEDVPSQMNLAIVGHVDSGKSTLSGMLLHLLGEISKKEMHQYERHAKEKGKGSFAYAWAMDESSEERERGVTMNVAVAYFATTKYRVVLLDSPGHKDFVPNLIAGASQADAAILVADASIGSFEAGMGTNGVGQTKEHAQLLRSFGIDQVIIAVNKMDLVGFSKERFEHVKLELGQFLRICGFKESSVTWIPLSVMENQNLLNQPSDVRLSSWYEGPCLLEAIDSLKVPNRDSLKPLRIPICDVITKHSMSQLKACGKIDTGAIRTGLKVLVMPCGDFATIRSVERDASSCPHATAGDNVTLRLHDVEADNIAPGVVLCHPDYPVTVASNLELKILVLDVGTPIFIGFQVELHIHHAKKAARVTKLLSVIDQKTGKVSKAAPRLLTSRQSAIIEVKVDGEVCVEEFSSNRTLGRVVLRASGITVAVGVVTHILDLES